MKARRVLQLLTAAATVLTVWCHVNNTKRHTFGYDGEMGPSHWADEYQQCAGKFQSPIDIEEHRVTHVRLPPLRFTGFDADPATSTLSNNGHTVMLRLNMSKMASVTGGPLRGDYSFSQLHFHWGNNDSMGSEDTINNHTFPLELHIVMYKAAYGSFDGATAHKDGLAVLAVFYEIIETENHVYKEIVEQLPSVTQPDTQALLQRPIKLASLLPETKHLYFTYNGSLTTPPCLEVVTWLEFKQPILLSHQQVDAFRSLKSAEGPMTHNFRPVQPLSGRPVWFNVADDYTAEPRQRESSAEAPSMNYILASVLVLLITAFQW
ncbi:carbonic anhydrase 2-like [Periplaneta americana]|uniref:carbonic anhydrase 2-like n=1 Tax=Periplaneta americana TaxID=6978 RepID=UPI0037E887BA